ncbi:unnamed protein product [Owenia fusiformis]|uniref:Uncharacterized protein n=1 Tax=Owenia fusiformis TaxID=6347 RepID=A0A8S4P215_OWEFU|nr:unnamed protein product [Owenia fusiformis]
MEKEVDPSAPNLPHQADPGNLNNSTHPPPGNPTLNAVPSPPTYNMYDVPEFDGPPPSYEQCVYNDPKTSYQPVTQPEEIQIAKPADTGLPALWYVDFFPRKVIPLQQPVEYSAEPRYEPFMSCMHQANYWLTQNLHYEVKTCECIERKVAKDGSVEGETTLWNRSHYNKTVYVRGLRIWIHGKADPNGPAQQLAHFNIKPEVHQISLTETEEFQQSMALGNAMAMSNMMMAGPFRRRQHNAMNMAMNMQMAANMCQGVTIPKFQSLEDALKQWNERLDENPIPGKLLNIETFEMKYSETSFFESTENHVDPEVTAWTQRESTSKMFVHVLRVFYVIGPPSGEKLGIMNFTPYLLEEMPRTFSVRQPKFEAYTSVLDRATNWVVQNQAINRVTNIQSINLRWERLNLKANIDPNSMAFAENPYVDTQFVRTVRIAYAINPAPIPPETPMLLTTKVMCPYKVGARIFETNGQNLQRVVAWLHLSGAKVLCAETVEYNFHPDAKIVRSDESYWKVTGHTGHYWLCCFRLYIVGPYTEPPASMLPPPPGTNGDRHSVG